MYYDANSIPNGITLTGFDVCIVGAGAAGIAMAVRLIPANKNVLVLTSGSSLGRGRPSPPDQSLYDGTIGAFMEKVDLQFLTRSRLRMYGGTTNHFGYWARPLEEADLKPRPGYREASWPLDIKELNDYYPAANETGRYGPFNYDDIPFWAEVLGGEPFPPQPDDRLQNAIFHAQYDEQIKDFQVQFGPALQSARNVSVLFNANVLTITSTGAKNHVTALDCRSLVDGKPNIQFKVESRSYVLAQGGIEVVRLLKLSGDLGDNRKGLLGRGFMVHPVITNAAEVTFGKPVGTLQRNFFREQQVRISCVAEPNQRARVVRGPVFDPEELAEYCSFIAWGVLEPKPAVMDAEKIGNFRLIFRFGSPTFTPVDINWEQIPNEDSTITLDQSKRDPIFGQPVVHLDWNLLEPDKQTIIKGLELCRRYLSAPGRDANNFRITTDLSGGPENWTFTSRSPNRLQAGDHHMGATRMSRTADDGIVNPDLRVHSVDNLYISSCAVFPTSGYANPTLTIVALAIRLADYLNRVL